MSTNAFAVAGETSFGIGYLDGRGNRYGVDAAGLFGGIAAGGTSLPHASLTMIAMASVGPSYTRFFSPRLEMDLSARGAVLAFAGGRQDILAYDNVIEFPAHLGFLGSIGTAYRLSAKGPVALTCALQGGLQFAGPQTASLLGVSLGVKFD